MPSLLLLHGRSADLLSIVVNHATKRVERVYEVNSWQRGWSREHCWAWKVVLSANLPFHFGAFLLILSPLAHSPSISPPVSHKLLKREKPWTESIHFRWGVALSNDAPATRAVRTTRSCLPRDVQPPPGRVGQPRCKWDRQSSNCCLRRLLPFPVNQTTIDPNLLVLVQ